VTPRFTITIKCFEKPGYAPLIEVIVKERAETVYVASGGDLETVMNAARDAIAECEETE
jgi:hypothetical protein